MTRGKYGRQLVDDDYDYEDEDEYDEEDCYDEEKEITADETSNIETTDEHKPTASKLEDDAELNDLLSQLIPNFTAPVKEPSEAKVCSIQRCGQNCEVSISLEMIKTSASICYCEFPRYACK